MYRMSEIMMITNMKKIYEEWKTETTINILKKNIDPIKAKCEMTINYSLLFDECIKERNVTFIREMIKENNVEILINKLDMIDDELLDEIFYDLFTYDYKIGINNDDHNCPMYCNRNILKINIFGDDDTIEYTYHLDNNYYYYFDHGKIIKSLIRIQKSKNYDFDPLLLRLICKHHDDEFFHNVLDDLIATNHTLIEKEAHNCINEIIKWCKSNNDITSTDTINCGAINRIKKLLPFLSKDSVTMEINKTVYKCKCGCESKLNDKYTLLESMIRCSDDMKIIEMVFNYFEIHQNDFCDGDKKCLMYNCLLNTIELGNECDDIELCKYKKKIFFFLEYIPLISLTNEEMNDLFITCINNNDNVVLKIIIVDNGIDIDNYQLNYLFFRYLLRSNNIDIIKMFIDNFDIIHKYNSEVQQLSICNNNIRLIIYLIENYSMSFNLTYDGCSLLHRVCNNYFEEKITRDILIKIIEYSSDTFIDMKDRYGRTPMYLLLTSFNLHKNAITTNDIDTLLYYLMNYDINITQVNDDSSCIELILRCKTIEFIDDDNFRKILNKYYNTIISYVNNSGYNLFTMITQYYAIKNRETKITMHDIKHMRSLLNVLFEFMTDEGIIFRKNVFEQNANDYIKYMIYICQKRYNEKNDECIYECIQELQEIYEMITKYSE
jgi:hypothetical protein